jgi:hypothetical protein
MNAQIISKLVKKIGKNAKKGVALLKQLLLYLAG